MKNRIFWIDGPWPGRVGIALRPRGGDCLEDEVHDWAKDGVDIVVSLLTQKEIDELDLRREAEFCGRGHMRHLAFPIPDRDVPASAQGFAQLISDLESALVAGKRVVIHCRQGIGRSAIVGAGLLVSSGARPAEAFQVITNSRGCAVPDTAQQADWLARFAHRSANAQTEV